MSDTPQVEDSGASVATDTPAIEAPVDRKDLLSQQFDQAEKAAPPEPPKAAPVAPSRDATGKFTPKTAAAGAPAAPAPAPDAPPVEPPSWKKPPASWKKEFHDAWAHVDPRIQEYAHKRESEMRASWSSAAGKAEFADSVQKVMEPYMNTVRGLGLDAPAAIKGLIEADHILRTSPPEQKAAYLAQLAQHYGIDIGQTRAAAAQHGAVDPNMSAMANQLNQVRGELQAWKDQQEAAANQGTLDQILAFAQGKEHFEAVRPLMISLLQSGHADNLESAYQMASRAHEDTYKSTHPAPQATPVATARAAADRAAKSARAAAVSVRSSTPGTHSAPKAQDRRSMLSEQFDNMNERF